MRITIVQGPFLPVPPLRGGAVEKAWSALGQEFARRGHVVAHISRRFPGLPDEETRDGVRHVRVGGFDAPRAWRPLGGIDVLWLVRLLLDWIYARRARKKIPPGDILITNTFWLPVLVTRESPFGRLFIHIGRFPRTQIALYRHAARLQAPSEAIGTALRRRLPENSGRVCVIPYPLAADTSLATSAEFDSAWAARGKIIVYAGRIHPQKGLELLIDAFRQFASSALGGDWRLRLVGPHEAELGGGGESYLHQLKIRAGAMAERIEWTGFVREPRNLKRHLLAAALFVYPSVDDFGETFGVAALEAMACGCPTIVSALACFRDFVVEGETGLVFDHRSPQAADELAALLKETLAQPDARRELARRGWETSRRFQLAPVAGEFLAEFEAMCSQP